MTNLAIQVAAAFLRNRIDPVPRLALVLGSGLGSLAEELEDAVAIPYGAIPHFPISTAPGHAGRLLAGKLGGKPVLVMQGRFHAYEGHSLERVVFPVRVFKELGIEQLFLTNASGGANPQFAPGDFMAITDHINFAGQNPLTGPNDDHLGPRFCDLSRAYDPGLRRLAHRAGKELGLGLRDGVYAWFAGPSFETPAEVRMARLLGADAVGMSTVPEVIAAAHCGLRVLAVSCIANMAAGLLDQPITSEEVFEISARRAPEFAALVRKIVALSA
jgi:purine-nucleoside phosphorylase